MLSEVRILIIFGEGGELVIRKGHDNVGNEFLDVSTGYIEDAQFIKIHQAVLITYVLF
jgi:hypothetical protein